MQRDGQLSMLLDGWRQYGDIVRFHLGPVNMILVARPEHVEHVLEGHRKNYVRGPIYQRKMRQLIGMGLGISEGDFWRRQRALMQPPFTARGIAPYAAEMVAATQDMLSRWEAQPDPTLEINREMIQLAMDVIGRTVFGMNFREGAMEMSEAFTQALDHLSRNIVTVVDVPRWIPTPANRRFNRALRTLDTFLYGIIERRERQPDVYQQATDLLSILLRARDGASGERMTRQQVRDEVMSVYFAGHETTAQALTWTWYLLSQHPEAETRLHAELDAVLGGRLPTLGDLHHLDYTRMVIEESMRLFPPVYAFARDAVTDDEIGGYHIPRGAMIILSPYVTHHHPQFWDAPERFEPERFTPERAKARHRLAYFPFASGPHTCIGNNFAMLEATLVLAMVAQRYRLRLVPNHPVEIASMITLRPRHGMRMTLEAR